MHCTTTWTAASLLLRAHSRSLLLLHRSFARRARPHQAGTASMSAPKAADARAAATLTATGVSWVKPLLRHPLPPSCALQRLRGEAVWTGDADQQSDGAAQLQHAMQAMSLSSGAGGAATASSSASPPPSASKAPKSPLRSPSDPHPTTPTKQSNKQKKKQAAASGDANVHLTSPPASASSSSPRGSESSPSISMSGCSLSPLPSHTLSSTIALLLDRVCKDEMSGLEFDADVSSKERAIMHKMAEERQLEHESLGFRPRRHLYAVKPYDAAAAPDQLYLVFRMGHLFVEGAPVDALGNLPCARVDEAMRGHRTARDGIHHHITLLHSGQVDILRETWPCQLEEERKAIEAEAASAAAADGSVTAASSSNGSAVAAAAPSSPSSPRFRVSSRVAEESVLRFFSSRLSEPPQELGLGRAASQSHEAFFRVVRWPQANELRRQLGLQPADFHITVGFKTQDIHGVKKDWTTLCEPNQEEEEKASRNPLG